MPAISPNITREDLDRALRIYKTIFVSHPPRLADETDFSYFTRLSRSIFTGIAQSQLYTIHQDRATPPSSPRTQA
ncbi:hypothetical protein JCM17844_26720 [Iodidimonas gelatinilytica]|uniref:Uncharacterized protein n=1 Tax=Iodidimonas gelatinilytica TaxID=1236966 RepID=A0A5A7MW07_9PROT|nr:hypothetical protein [Iodidimonas gelatinilytica]GEQ99035.1 hypothetical protein JCM17844_26720 [Iodidimonas gelatinilytica]GER00781.1 hypothetical protein JCM17845_14040 [Iodidimonas gelatinilytica]